MSSYNKIISSETERDNLILLNEKISSFFYPCKALIILSDMVSGCQFGCQFGCHPLRNALIRGLFQVPAWRLRSLMKPAVVASMKDLSRGLAHPLREGCQQAWSFNGRVVNVFGLSMGGAST